MTARTLVVAAIEAVLGTIAGVASVETMPSGDPDAFPALALYDEGHRPVEEEAAVTRYELAVRVEGSIVGGSGADALARLNDLYAAVVAAVVTVPPLPQIEMITEGDLRIEVGLLADERRLGFSLDLIVQFATPRGDPSRFA